MSLIFFPSRTVFFLSLPSGDWDQVVADLGLLISRQHGPGGSSSAGPSKPRLARFISAVTLPRGVFAGGSVGPKGQEKSN